MYDPNLGRWSGVDKLAEEYSPVSPYVYLNNPIRFWDPDGKRVYFAPGASDQFKSQFVATVKYMNSRGTAGILNKVESHKGTVYIKEDSDGSRFSPSEMTIKWNPSMGLMTTTGTMLSPATVLNHELDHALRRLIDPEGQKEDLKIDSENPYDNKEEERVITGSEQETAEKHGETEEGKATRTDHAGSFFPVESPISNEYQFQNPIVVQPRIWNYQGMPCKKIY